MRLCNMSPWNHRYHSCENNFWLYPLTSARTCEIPQSKQKQITTLLLGMPHPTSENLPSKIYISPQSPSGSTHLPGPPSVPLPPTLIQVICLSGFRWYVSHS
eukprot:jgi/Chrzof1/8045/UNPLg00090.t1